MNEVIPFGTEPNSVHLMAFWQKKLERRGNSWLKNSTSSNSKTELVPLVADKVVEFLRDIS